MVNNIAYVLYFMFLYLCTYGFNVDVNFPIVYEDIYSSPIKERQGYFGYSILLGPKWLHIGAPRSNSSENKDNESGAVYQCKIYGPCTEMVLRNTYGSSNNSWFGVAMDYDAKPKGKEVVCGHRWMDERQLGTTMFGNCYWFETMENSNKTPVLLFPLHSLDTNNIYHTIGNRVTGWKYGLSQSGISAHFTQKHKGKGSELLLGAPGTSLWEGSVLKYSSLRDKPKVLDHTFLQKRLRAYDYFGYQVSSGNFFKHDEKLYVASAPRAEKLKGYVLVFDFPKRDRSEWDWITAVSGEYLGEYFGSSLAAADINGDSLADLVVGAPFCSNNGDEGCIYIYTKDDKITQKTLKLLGKIMGKKVRGLFGTAVASLGDIDQDGKAGCIHGCITHSWPGQIVFSAGASFNIFKLSDIAVGAPFEASDIYSGLEGFGITIARPVDMDENNYADVAIGSFLSGHVVLLRSYPVVTLKATLKSHSNNIKLNDTHLLVEACLSYTGRHVPQQINTTREISVLDTYGRGKVQEYEINVMLKNEKETCDNITIVLKALLEVEAMFPPFQQSYPLCLLWYWYSLLNSIPHNIYSICLEPWAKAWLKFWQNIYHGKHLDGIVVELSLHLDKKPANSSIIWIRKNGTTNLDSNKFCSSCPVTPHGDTSFKINIPYALDCGADKVCKSDIKLNCSLQHDGRILNSSKPYTIGSYDKLSLVIQVKNTGEPAYGAIASVNLPNSINLASIPIDCYEEENTQLILCNLGAVKQEKIENITLDLDVSGIDIEETSSLHIDVHVSSSSTDIDEKSNSARITLNLVVDAGLSIYGKSQKDIYTYSKLQNEFASSVVAISHVYEIVKQGVSPIKYPVFELLLPLKILHTQEPKQFLTLVEPKVYGKDSLLCYSNITYTYVPSETHEIIDIEISSTRKKRSGKNYNSVNHTYIPPANRTLFINCTSYNIICEKIICRAEKFTAFAKVVLDLKLHMTVLGPLMGQKDIVYISTVGSISTPSPNVASEMHRLNSTEVSSTLIGNVAQDHVELWIIVASVIAGILLIMLVVMGLAKAGFFQRKIKAELEALKEAEDNAEKRNTYLEDNQQQE